ncbi:MAG: hypothetical protein ABFS34_01095 [Gemmatimonadota bacterium]
MIKPSRAAALILPALAFGSCADGPLAPEALAPEDPSFASHGDAPLVDLRASSGVDPIEMQVNGTTVLGSFSARLIARPGVQTGVVVTEWDSGAPKSNTVEIELVALDLVSIDPVPIIEFVGKGRLRDGATGRLVEFEVSGTAQQSATEPDCVLFDFIGGGLYDAQVELPGRLEVRR